MKRLLLSLVLGVLVVAPVFAEKNGEENKGLKFLQSKERGNFLASDLVGKPLYVTEKERVPERVPESPAELPDDWENVGDISDCIVTRDGKVTAVLVDVGGFLGIGSRTVAVSMQAVEFVGMVELPDMVGLPEREYPHDFFVVFPGMARDALEAAPELELQSALFPLRR